MWRPKYVPSIQCDLLYTIDKDITNANFEKEKSNIYAATRTAHCIRTEIIVLPRFADVAESLFLLGNPDL